MTVENHRIWRALLQLGQITEAVFEREIPNTVKREELTAGLD